MALFNLTQKLSDAFGKLRGKGKITERDLRDGLRQVRMALIEADVNLDVVKSFIAKVQEVALGQNILESLQPDQHIIKIVRDELTELMGATNAKLILSSSPAIIMMCGLQGAGKTTSCAKLATILKKQGKRPLLIACDVYRPAAIKQLTVVGNAAGVPVFTIDGSVDVPHIAASGVDHGKKNGNDVILIDTAGRLHIDEQLMQELQHITEVVNVGEILLTVDAMTGQDAANVARTFNDRLPITGCILTKFDSDTRGGAALSVRAITGKPIKYITTGEKLADIEPFHPDRIASRILGMGDVLTIIDKAEAAVDEKKARELEERLRKNRLTLTDFLEQLQQMKNMGSMQDILDLMPGMGNLKNLQVDEAQLARTEAIVLSMTVQERDNPSLINGSRKKRIAAGCGRTVQDVNALLRQFDQMQTLMKQLSGAGGKKMSKKLKRAGFNLPMQ